MSIQTGKTIITGYVSDDQVDALERVCAETGMTKAQVVETALREYLSGGQIATRSDVRKVRSGSRGEMLINIPAGHGIYPGDYCRIYTANGTIVAKKM